MLLKQKIQFKLLIKAHLEYMYLDFLNQNFVNMFKTDLHLQTLDSYNSLAYSGLLFNISIQWIKDDCKMSKEDLADMILRIIYD